MFIYSPIFQVVRVIICKEWSAVQLETKIFHYGILTHPISNSK